MIGAPVPCLTYDEAELVGLAVRRRWKALTGKKKTPFLRDEQWADVIQTVLRHAAQVVSERGVNDEA
jgi:hypothetical protein